MLIRIGNPTFYIAYPTFIADWAGMHATRRFASLKSAAPVWLSEMFGQCPEHRLSKNRPNVDIEPDLYSLSAKCLRIVFDGLKDGEMATVRILAAPQSGTVSEEFHLSEIERSGMVPLRCAEMLDQKKTVVAGADCVVNRSITKAKRRPISFTPRPFFAGTGKNAIVFALSRVALTPKDADIMEKPKKIKLFISTDFGQVSMGGQNPKPVHPVFIGSRQWSESTLPMDIQPETLAAQEGKMNLPAAAPAIPGAGPFSPGAFTAFNPMGDGAWAMTFSTYDVRVSGSPQGPSPESERRDTYTLYFEEGTQLAQGQSLDSFVTVRPRPSASFLSALSKNGASPAVGRRDFEPTIVTVREYSEDRMTLDFNGRICFGQGLGGGPRVDRRSCLSIEPFSGTLSVAFPKLYTRNGHLKYDRQSQGNRIYRDRRAAWMNVALGQAFSGGVQPGNSGSSAAQPGSPSPIVGGGAAPAAAPCDCSCEGMEKLKEKMQGGTPAQALTLGACFFQCAAQYARCTR